MSWWCCALFDVQREEQKFKQGIPRLLVQPMLVRFSTRVR